MNVATQGAQLVSLVLQKRSDILFLSETLAHPTLLDSLKGKTGSVRCVCIPWERDSKELGLFWSSSVQVHYSYHHIDVEVVMSNLVETWQITGLYGYARDEDKVFNGDLMRTLEYQYNLPWLVLGDFNEILYNDENSGGPRRQVGSILLFREALVDCKLEDMGYFGSKFTWSNKFTKELLDRGLCYSEWQDLFSYFRVATFPPNKSDQVRF